MLKVSIALIAICAGTVGAALWTESGARRPTKSPIPQLTMPSLEELHARAGVENLPMQELKEPF
jgi:hypothetical protein